MQHTEAGAGAGAEARARTGKKQQVFTEVTGRTTDKNRRIAVVGISFSSDGN